MDHVPNAFCDDVVALVTTQHCDYLPHRDIPKWGSFFRQHHENRHNFHFILNAASTVDHITQFVELFSSYNVRHSRLCELSITGSIPIQFQDLLDLISNLLKFFDPHSYFSTLNIMLPSPQTNEILRLLLERHAYFKDVTLRHSCEHTLPYLAALETDGRLKRLSLRDLPPGSDDVVRNLILQDQFDVFDGSRINTAIDSIEVDVFKRLVEKWLAEDRPQWAKIITYPSNLNLVGLEGVLKRANTQLQHEAFGRRHTRCDSAAIALSRNGDFTLYFVNDTSVLTRDDRFVLRDEYCY